MTNYVLEPTPVSALEEVESVTSADWLIVFQDGQLVANKVHPGNATLFSTSNPSALGTASPGSASTSARSDHVHPLSTGSNATNFNCNLLHVYGGYIYRYTTDNVSNISLGDLSTQIVFRNDNGSLFYTLSNDPAPVICGNINSNAITPLADNTHDLGASDKRWDDIYATNGTIETSDSRAKIDIEPSDLGLEFILSLRPVRYRTYRREIDYIEPGEDGGKRKTLPEKRGARPHYGLLAQEVKQSLGARDFAGYIYDEKTDMHGLRYSEFIAPLIRAVQELTARVEELERGKKPARA